MKVIGEEESNIRTLNYAPGPLDTDMMVIACKDTKDPALRTWFQGDCFVVELFYFVYCKK